MTDLDLARAAAAAWDSTCPALVLDLCDEIERLRAEVKEMAEDVSAARLAVSLMRDRVRSAEALALALLDDDQ